MARAMLLTVGLSFRPNDDITQVLAADIRHVQPDFVLVLCTEESTANAEETIRHSGVPAEQSEILRLPSAENLNDVFSAVNSALRGLIARGYSPEDITVNYTSGTKVMSGAALLAAVINNVAELRYLYAGSGRSEPPSERTVTTRGAAMSAYRDLLMARRLLEEMRFQSSRDLLARTDRSLLAEPDQATVGALHSIAVGYFHWDNFQYQRFLDATASIPEGQPLAEPFLMEPEARAVIEVLASDIAAGRFSEALFADILNNASRRALEGKFDDAMMRIYRALEVLAQHVLAQMDIDTNDLDTRRVPPRHRVNFEALRSMEDGAVRLGLRKSYELLMALDTPVGRAFAENEPLRQALNARRQSILAHGTRPVSTTSYQGLLASARQLFAVEFPGFEAMCRQLQFPWLRERCSVQEQPPAAG